MLNLGLNYTIKYVSLHVARFILPCSCHRVECRYLPAYRYMGTSENSEKMLQKRLEAQLPTLFFLWEPHKFFELYKLTRIQLPMHNRLLFKEGKTDYPIDILEKVAWKGLGFLAPRVHQLVASYRLQTDDQESIMKRIDMEGLSLFQTACAWLKNNNATWSQWLPKEDKALTFKCTPGQLVEGNICRSCGPGLYSDEGTKTACQKCLPGFFSRASAAACDPCSPGTFAKENGMRKCSVCKAGFFSNQSAAASCTPCSPGTFAEDVGMNKCSICSVIHCTALFLVHDLLLKSYAKCTGERYGCMAEQIRPNKLYCMPKIHSSAFEGYEHVHKRH